MTRYCSFNNGFLHTCIDKRRSYREDRFGYYNTSCYVDSYAYGFRSDANHIGICTAYRLVTCFSVYLTIHFFFYSSKDRNIPWNIFMNFINWNLIFTLAKLAFHRGWFCKEIYQSDDLCICQRRWKNTDWKLLCYWWVDKIVLKRSISGSTWQLSKGDRLPFITGFV